MKSDPLLDCLVYLSSCFGNSVSAESVVAGLAYDENGLTPKLFSEAADRINIKSMVTRRAIEHIPTAVLPCVLTLTHGGAVVLKGFDKKRKKAVIYTAEDKKTKKVSLQDLKKDYSGYAIFVSPKAEETDIDEYHHDDIYDKSNIKDVYHLHWFWSIFFKNTGIYIQVIIAAILINLFALTSPIFIMTFYDRVLPNNAIETGWVLAIGALIILSFDFVVRSLRGYFIDLAGKKVDVIAAGRIFDQVMDMKLSERPVSSGVFANMLRDFDSVRDFFTSATLTAIVDFPFTILFLAVIYIIGGPIAFVLATLIIIVLVAGFIIQFPLKGTVKKSQKTSETKHGILVESIHGLETIKAIGADGKMRARYSGITGENAIWSQRSRFISALGVNIATLLQQSATILVVITGMYLVMDSQLTTGGLIACVILGGRAIAPIGQIANIMTRRHQAFTALKTLNKIMSKPTERPRNKKFLHRPDLSGKIVFDKVSFSYPNSGKKALDNVSFAINAGEKVGVIGRIGSGKSTIARLMLGLYEPNDGRILFDDTDFRQIDPADLRHNTGYIAQDVMLFSGSIKENITVSRPQASEAEILAVSQQAGVHDFVKQHPMGYDAQVGERGEKLSGGQRQSIALARALLTSPKIMVCDEPTNSMDVQAEENFRRHIEKQAEKMTLILITHRQQLLSVVDRLILLDQGVVVMDDDRDVVLRALSSGDTKK